MPMLGRGDRSGVLRVCKQAVRSAGLFGIPVREFTFRLEPTVNVMTVLASAFDKPSVGGDALIPSPPYALMHI
jgi:hypothetical protein